jgi:hypothetical protein
MNLPGRVERIKIRAVDGIYLFVAVEVDGLRGGKTPRDVRPIRDHSPLCSRRRIANFNDQVDMLVDEKSSALGKENAEVRTGPRGTGGADYDCGEDEFVESSHVCYPRAESLHSNEYPYSLIEMCLPYAPGYA